MPALNASLTAEITRLTEAHVKRELRETAGAGVEVMRDGKRLISFSGNDYLGLSQHPEVKEAAKKAVDEYGVGAGASRLVTGNHPLYAQMERKLARLKNQEAACVFGSGYLANLGVIPALVGPRDLILADKFIHACMLDGAKLSGAKLVRFAHNDPAHAEELLTKHRADYARCLVLTESVFSMDGDRAPLKELSALAKQQDAWLMVDDAHGFPSLPQGEEIVWMGTLSKAMGTYGGYIAASRSVIEYLHNSARSLIYSTALPPMIVAASVKALEIIEREPERCVRPLHLAQRFTKRLDLPEAQSAIVPVMLGDNQKALSASKTLEDGGFLVTAIRPPTVPPGTARLRVTFSTLHEESQVDKLAGAMKAFL